MLACACATSEMSRASLLASLFHVGAFSSRRFVGMASPLLRTGVLTDFRWNSFLSRWQPAPWLARGRDGGPSRGAAVGASGRASPLRLVLLSLRSHRFLLLELGRHGISLTREHRVHPVTLVIGMIINERDHHVGGRVRPTHTYTHTLQCAATDIT